MWLSKNKSDMFQGNWSVFNWDQLSHLHVFMDGKVSFDTQSLKQTQQLVIFGLIFRRKLSYFSLEFNLPFRFSKRTEILGVNI